MTAHGDPRRPVILVVDEETQIRVAISDHLHESGFRVVDADTTDKALDLLKHRSDIAGAVIDAHVPGRIDGVELVGRICRDRPDMTVVMTSGHSDETSGALPEGSTFVNKPNLFEQLVPLLQRTIAAAR